MHVVTQQFNKCELWITETDPMERKEVEKDLEAPKMGRGGVLKKNVGPIAIET